MAVMSTPVTSRGSDGGLLHGMTHRQLDAYPDSGPRFFQLALVVLVTVALYYENYVTGSVSTLQLPALHMSFTFYVTVLAFANLFGAFASLVAGLSDRLGRCNLIVGGLLITGVLTAFVIPAMTSKWAFAIATFALGLVEGIVLVATPALVRDFSPQVGRATAMGFWTMGPVLGSLVVSVVGTNTINAHTTWPHEYRICGVVGLIVFAIAAIGLRELAPSLRDQLMVSTKDRVLIEAKAKGINIEESLRNPWGQMLKADIIISAVGVAVLLLAYYTAVGFGTILFTTIFGFTLKDANGLGNWNWLANAVGLVAIGLISDKLRVRKPFMIVGGIGAALSLGWFLSRFGHHTSYYQVALIVSISSVFLAFAYAPWMASFTETVEARNPALTATGLAVWGWIIRVVVFASFIILPHVINTVTPLVTYGTAVQTDAVKYKSQIAFAQSHASLIAFAQTHQSVIATATKYQTQLGDAQKFAPELAAIEAHPALFTQLGSYSSAAAIPPALLAQGISAAGGGAQGLSVLQSISTNKAAILGVVAVAPQLQSLAPYGAQLTQLAANGPQLQAVSQAAPALKFLSAHAAAVQDAAKKSPGQWQHWYWICIIACLFFLGTVPLMRGRWNPSDARADEEAHEKMVRQEMAQLHVS